MLVCTDCFCWNCVRDAEAEVDHQIGDYVYLVVIGIIPLAVDTLEGVGGEKTIP